MDRKRIYELDPTTTLNDTDVFLVSTDNPDDEENKVSLETLSNKILDGVTIDVDAELSTESENPVQNKVITNHMNAIVQSIPTTSDYMRHVNPTGEGGLFLSTASTASADFDAAKNNVVLYPLNNMTPDNSMKWNIFLNPANIVSTAPSDQQAIYSNIFATPNYRGKAYNSFLGGSLTVPGDNSFWARNSVIAGYTTLTGEMAGSLLVGNGSTVNAYLDYGSIFGGNQIVANFSSITAGNIITGYSTSASSSNYIEGSIIAGMGNQATLGGTFGSIITGSMSTANLSYNEGTLIHGSRYKISGGDAWGSLLGGHATTVNIGTISYGSVIEGAHNQMSASHIEGVAVLGHSSTVTGGSLYGSIFAGYHNFAQTGDKMGIAQFGYNTSAILQGSAGYGSLIAGNRNYAVANGDKISSITVAGDENNISIGSITGPVVVMGQGNEGQRGNPGQPVVAGSTAGNIYMFATSPKLSGGELSNVFVTGYNTSASVGTLKDSIIQGDNNTISGSTATNIYIEGKGNLVSGSSLTMNMLLGEGSTSNNAYNFLVGKNNFASAGGSHVFGQDNSSHSAYGNVILGHRNSVTGSNPSLVLGSDNNIAAYGGGVTIGQRITNYQQNYMMGHDLSYPTGNGRDNFIFGANSTANFGGGGYYNSATLFGTTVNTSGAYYNHLETHYDTNIAGASISHNDITTLDNSSINGGNIEYNIIKGQAQITIPGTINFRYNNIQGFYNYISTASNINYSNHGMSGISIKGSYNYVNAGNVAIEGSGHRWFDNGSGWSNYGFNNHIEGIGNKVVNTTTVEFNSYDLEGLHIEGYENSLTDPLGIYGSGIHIEGYANKVIGSKHGLHIEGQNSTADNAGVGVHIEGYGHYVSTAGYAHVEGNNNRVTGSYSHAEGLSTTASGLYSHAGGLNTIANQDAQTAIGTYNTTSTDALFIVGNGTSTATSNALEVNKDGSANLQGDLTVHYSGTAFDVGQSLAAGALPAVTTADTGKVLSVNNSGVWSAATAPRSTYATVIEDVSVPAEGLVSTSVAITQDQMSGYTPIITVSSNNPYCIASVPSVITRGTTFEVSINLYNVSSTATTAAINCIAAQSQTPAGPNYSYDLWEAVQIDLNGVYTGSAYTLSDLQNAYDGGDIVKYVRIPVKDRIGGSTPNGYMYIFSDNINAVDGKDSALNGQTAYYGLDNNGTYNSNMTASLVSDSTDHYNYYICVQPDKVYLGKRIFRGTNQHNIVWKLGPYASQCDIDHVYKGSNTRYTKLLGDNAELDVYLYSDAITAKGDNYIVDYDGRCFYYPTTP